MMYSLSSFLAPFLFLTQHFFPSFQFHTDILELNFVFISTTPKMQEGEREQSCLVLLLFSQ